MYVHTQTFTAHAPKVKEGTHTCAHTHTHLRTRTHTYTQMRTHMHARTHMHSHAHTLTHMHRHLICTYTRTNACTHTCALLQGLHGERLCGQGTLWQVRPGTCHPGVCMCVIFSGDESV